jgi:glycosyltransferase involved in cell wall biosynthesis
MKSARLVIALPALNESDNLPGVLRSLPRELPGVEDIRLVVVDDGSTDATASIAREEGASVIRHPRTLGVGKAFQSALKEALRIEADILVTMDADGQFDTGEIPDLVAPILRGEADFVTGTRFAGASRPPNMPRVKYWGNRLVTRFLRHFTMRGLTDVSCGFRAYSREALYNLNLFGRFTYTQETILDLSFKDLRLVEVPVSVRYFPDRKSRVATSVPRYGVNAFKIIVRTARDFKPMRFFGVLGVLVFLLGLALDGWLLAYFLQNGSFSPYKFVGFVGVTLNVAGILVFGLALLADMLDRMRVNQERLLYHLRKAAHRRSEEEPPRSTAGD